MEVTQLQEFQTGGGGGGEGTDLSERKVTEGFQHFQGRGSGLSAQKVTSFNNSRVGGSAQKVTERFQEFQSRGN